MSELAERVRGIAASARAREQSRRVDNREQMPTATAFVDDFRRVFGSLPAGRMTENGRTVEWGDLLAGTAVPASVNYRRTR